VNLVPEENLTENQKYMMKVISHEFKCEYRWIWIEWYDVNTGNCESSKNFTYLKNKNRLKNFHMNTILNM
jgi:hypothetical protein